MNPDWRWGEDPPGGPGPVEPRRFDRRQLLKLGAVAAVAGLVGHPRLAGAGRLFLPSRKISLYNIHTDEKLSVEYCAEGEYCPEAFREINHFFRDFRTGEIKPIDPGLLDLLQTIARKVKPDSRVHLVSGYRSPATNRLLRQESDGVARHSLHMQGLAADIRMPGSDLRTLHRVALGLRAGGVGYYPASDFIHVDTGRVRYW